jgi:hypothetical protein
MLAGHLGAGGATAAASDLGGGGEARCHIQTPNPRIATRISPEIHFRGLCIAYQRFAISVSDSPPETL